MQEGLANVCLVTSAMTITRAKIERKIPKKDMVSDLFYLRFFYSHRFTIRYSQLYFYLCMEIVEF